MSPLYATDWHQCTRCGCTRPRSELCPYVNTDPVLKLVSTAFACRDGAICNSMKEGIAELQQRRKLNAQLEAVNYEMVVAREKRIAKRHVRELRKRRAAR